MTAGEGGLRLNPGRSHPRYYGLVTLRDSMLDVIERHVRPVAESAGNGLTVVDFGCGDCPYRPLFSPVCRTYIGADLPGSGAEATIDPNTNRVDMNDDSADVVLSTQVLEHVASPSDYLAEALRLCRGGGVLILSTHGIWPYHPHPTDYWRWTSTGLAKTLTDSGWTVTEMTGVLGLAPAALSLLQDVVRSKAPRMLDSAVSRIFQKAIAWTDRRYSPSRRLDDATLYLVVATPAER